MTVAVDYMLNSVTELSIEKILIMYKKSQLSLAFLFYYFLGVSVLGFLTVATFSALIAFEILLKLNCSFKVGLS